jgi:uncharacterized protein YjiS (DUF1127 family)
LKGKTLMTAIVSVLNAAVLRCVSIFLLPTMWRRRARFRKQLRADMQNAPDFLGDIGIDAPEAQAEAMRFFWERSNCCARLATRRLGINGICAWRRRKPG